MGMATTESQFHVLAVDDSIIDRKLIERLLKTSSYQVTTVDSGSKALEFLGFHEDDQINPNIPYVSPDNHQEVEVNLIITDYCMPGMTGYDLLKKIKESSSLRNIPVVIMSSENVPSRINRCLEEGAEEFFLKPVRLADVNRLKPHIMKAKAKDQKQEKEELESEMPELHLQLQDESAIPELHLQLQEESVIPELHLQLQDESAIPELHLQLQEESVIPELHIQQQESAELEIESQLQGLPMAQQEQSNKRKTMEEGISTADRTRPRFTGLTTMV